MAVQTYEYRIDGSAWIEAAGPTVSLTGLEPGTMYRFETRAKDDAGNYSEPTPSFYVTMPYEFAMLTDNDGKAIVDDNGKAIRVLRGSLYNRA